MLVVVLVLHGLYALVATLLLLVGVQTALSDSSASQSGQAALVGRDHSDLLLLVESTGPGNGPLLLALV